MQYNNTLGYYDSHADKFYKSTVNIEFTTMHEKFLTKLEKGFKAIIIFLITSSNSPTGKCSIDEHAQMPSYLSTSDSSWKRMFFTLIPLVIKTEIVFYITS